MSLLLLFRGGIAPPVIADGGGGWFNAEAETRFLLDLIASRKPVEIPKIAEIIRIIKRDNKTYYNAFTAKPKAVQRTIIKEVQTHLEDQDAAMLARAMYELF